MTTKNSATSLHFATVGRNGVKLARDGDMLMVQIPLNDAARKAAPMSQSGKTRLLGNTGGFVHVDGTDIKLNVTATIPAK